MATRRFSPPESEYGERPVKVPDPEQFQRLADPPLHLIIFQTCLPRREGHVFLDRRGEQTLLRKLKHQPDPAAQFAFFHSGSVRAVHQYLAAGRYEQEVHVLHQRALAGACSANDAEHLTFFSGQ